MKNAKKFLSIILAGGMMMQAGWQTAVFADGEKADNSLQAIYDRIMTGTSFSEEDFKKVRGAFQYMSVEKADGIVVDGDSSDWEQYQGMPMPTLDTQYQVYIDDGRDKDATGIAKFAYDEEKFYFMIAVEDDQHVYETGTSYWSGDSLQIAVSNMDETYGTEIGMIHNASTGEGEIYGDAFSPDQMAKINLKTSQQGTKTIYECSIPWTVKFRYGMPDKLKFCVIINDNDGYGRRYCVELAPGIAEGKTNVKFPVLELAKESKPWYGWSQNDLSADMGEDLNLDTFIVNSGETEEVFTITSTMDEQAEQVTVPAHSGIHYRMVKNFPDINDVGKHEETITIADNQGNTADTKCTFEISEPVATVEEATEILKKEKAQTEEIKKLLDECAAQGIITEYETVAYNTLNRFVGYIETQDIPRNDLGRMFYTERAMDNIYRIAKENLEKYLAKEKEPFTVPRYETSEVRIQDLATYAMTNHQGVREERPVFFVGYGHFNEVQDEVTTIHRDYGVNTIQMEAGTVGVVNNAPEIKGWDMMKSGNPTGDISVDTSVYTEGSSSLKFTMQSPYADNYFFTVWQTVAVEPGRTYTLKGKAKAENAACVYITAYNWDERVFEEGTFDWRSFEQSYTAPAGKTQAIIRMCCYNTTGAVWFDDLSFIDEETGENLLKNGGLEKNTEILTHSTDSLAYYANVLKRAEEGNIAVSFLISPHYFPSNIEKIYPDLKRGYHFYNVNDPRVRAVYEEYIRKLIPAIKDYKSLNNIILSNEAEFKVSDYYEAYADSWHEYLKNEYHNDITYLNQAYRTNYESFDEIDIYYTMSDIAKYLDVTNFTTQEFSRWHKWMYDLVKELAPDITVTTKNMGYMNDIYQAGLLNKGMNHQDLSEFLDVNGCDDDNYLTRLKEPLVKEYWYEYLVGIQNTPVYNTEDHVAWDYDPYYGMDMAPYMSQDIWQGAIHGRALTDIWLWDRNSVTSVRDASILYRPDALYDIAKVSMDLNRNSYEITAIQQEPREAGVLYTDASLFANATTMHCMYEIFANSAYNGVKTHLIPDRQTEQMYKYRLVFIPDVQYANENILKEIKNYIDQGGRVVIYGKESLKQNDKALPNNAELVNYIYAHAESYDYLGTATDCSIPGGMGFFEDLKKIYKEEKLPVVDIVDAETGEDVWKVESNLGVYNGKLIINLENFLQDKTVNIYVNGQKVTKAYELRDGLEFDANIPLTQYVPVLLEVEVDTPFLDTFQHWSRDEVSSLARTGIISGVCESRFAPDKTITRAEFLALLMRAAKFDTVSYSGGISDVESGKWYADNVAAALANGIIDGGAFRPEENITREEMCTLLVRTYEKLHGEMTLQNISFTDRDQISDITIVSKAAANNLIYGMTDGSFAPKANSTRAEAAAVIARFLNK